MLVIFLCYIERLNSANETVCDLHNGFAHNEAGDHAESSRGLVHRQQVPTSLHHHFREISEGLDPACR
jgi:hypothetical protein